MDQPVFQVTYGSWTALARDCKQQIAMRGLFVKTKAALAQFAQVGIRLTAPDGQEFELTGEVVQAVPDQGVAVQFSAESAGAIDQIQQLSKLHPPDESAKPDQTDPQFTSPGQEAAKPQVRTEQSSAQQTTRGDAVNLRDQVDAMSVAQKRQAALHGRREMRLLMMRDRNKTIHPFVIKNPAITLDEIEQFAKMPSVNPDVLRMIAKNREWTRSTTVCRSLVRNPKTPMKEALMLMNKLPINEIRMLAKSGNVRTAIQQAARKKVAG